MVQDAAGKREIVVDGLPGGKHKQPQVDEERAELGEQVLVPGQAFHTEARAGRIPHQLQNEPHPSRRTQQNRGVQAPVPADSFQRPARIPEIVRQQEQGRQGDRVLFSRQRSSKEDKNYRGTEPGHSSPASTQIDCESRQIEHYAEGFRTPRDVGYRFGLNGVEEKDATGSGRQQVPV